MIAAAELEIGVELAELLADELSSIFGAEAVRQRLHLVELNVHGVCISVVNQDAQVLCQAHHLVHDVLRHRIGITYEAEAENITSEDIINRIVNVVEVP